MSGSRIRRAGIPIGIGLLAAGLLTAIIWIPIHQTNGLPKVERVRAETAARDVLIKGVGGLLVFITAFIGWKNLKATERGILVSEEKQITERFSKAVEMLGHEKNVHIRLGGIYALERIAVDSRKDQYPVMQVLAAFVRTRASVLCEQEANNKQQEIHQGEEFSLARLLNEQEEEERLGSYTEEYQRDMSAGDYKYYVGTPNKNYVPNQLVDVQAAVSAIGRLNLSDSSVYILDLSKTLLEGICFEGNYKNVNFHKTHFKGCTFGTELEKDRAIFKSNNFRETIFEKAKVNNCYFEDAYFNSSVFLSSIFENTNFMDVEFVEAKFSGGTYINRSQFKNVKLNEVSIGTQTNLPRKADGDLGWPVYFMERSEIKNTDFAKADFRKANIVNTIFKEGNYIDIGFEEATLSGVTFENVNLKNYRFTKTKVGQESKLNVGNGQKEGRKFHQEKYSDEIRFKNAGIERIDLEKGQAIIIEAKFN